MDTISFNPERYQIEITNMMDKFFNDSILSLILMRRTNFL